MPNKEKPIKIQWNEYARGFYCPSCFTGTASNTEQCKYCGQKLLPMYNFNNSKKPEFIGQKEFKNA